VSKARAVARAERERLAAVRAAGQQARREEEATGRARRERRDLAWRRVRLWRHGPGYRRHKDGIAALLTLAMVLLLLAYLLTSSLVAVLLVLLVLVIAAPVLVMLTFDRKRR
jgi:Flp pilus assembly protein TadB